MKGETILCIGESDWDTWRLDHEFLPRLAAGNTAIFVDAYARRETLTLNTSEYLRQQAGRYLHRQTEWVAENILRIRTPYMLPLTVRFLSRFFLQPIAYAMVRLSKALQLRKLRADLHQLGLCPTVFFVQEPYDLLLVGGLGEDVSCYRVYDEVAHFPTNRPFAPTISRIEKEFIDRVDLVFASSVTEYRNRQSLHPNVHLIPNSIDFDAYQAIRSSLAPEPEELQGIRHPIIGCSGAVDYRMDFDLLRRLASEHPEWSIVLVGIVRGYCQEQVESLSQLGNVFALGNKPVDVLPLYLRAFDVALIPYQVTPSTNSMYFWKTGAYLALGKPVVSTDLFEVREAFGAVVRLARTAEEFIAMVGEELQANSSEKIRHRIEFARQNSWEVRVAEMSRLIDQALVQARATRR